MDTHVSSHESIGRRGIPLLAPQEVARGLRVNGSHEDRPMPSPLMPNSKPRQATEEPDSEIRAPEEAPLEQPKLPELDAMTRFLPRELLGLPCREETGEAGAP